VADPVTVFLLDDHEIVRRGVRYLLDAEDELVVVGEASTEDEAVRRIPALDPDVAVLDVRLQDGDGITACREIRSRHPRTACLMLTSFADDEALFHVIMAGAAGYVLKQIRSSDLVDAVRRVAAGQQLLGPAVTARVMERLRKGPDEDELIARLSPQERRVLILLADGLTNRQIAPRLRCDLTRTFGPTDPIRRSASSCHEPRHRRPPGADPSRVPAPPAHGEDRSRRRLPPGAADDPARALPRRR
jgi:two-component system response regulator DevR